MPSTDEAKPMDSAIARVVRLAVGIAIGIAVICGGRSESRAGLLAVQYSATQNQVAIGKRGVFDTLSDGCPTLEQLNRLTSDRALHDLGAYYQDFRRSGCVEVIKGDKGTALEFNFTSRANRIRLDQDHEAYWFTTVGTDGTLRFIAP